jgi:hypothetical protein
MQNQRIKEEQKDPFLKRVLIVDDEPDIILTLKLGLEQNNTDKRFEVYAYNDPAIALSEFKPY